MASFTDNGERVICNYEGTSYRANFWEGHGREYEDLAERIALRKLLPASGRRLVDVGAGFGRLVDLYDGYEQVVLLDYATSGLREAQDRLGRSKRFIYVAADVYELPLAPGACDTVVSVRVLHHLSDVPAVLRAIASALRPGGTYVLEYANKRNLKAIFRYLLRRQNWSPFAAEPLEFTALNFDFHPAWMEHELAMAGFEVDAGLAVSHFRHPLFKRLLPARPLARIDGFLQQPGAPLKLAPSVFLRSHRPVGPGSDRLPRAQVPDAAGGARSDLFACPACRGQTFSETAEALQCSTCGAIWDTADGIYDFRRRK